MASEPSFGPSGSAVEIDSSSKPLKKPVRKLFSRGELCHYGVAAVVYIILGVLLQGAVLNWIVGPLFIVVWMWWVPPLVEKWRSRRS